MATVGIYPACGNQISNRAPPAGALLAEILPPCRSTMALTIERPSPLPDGNAVPVRDTSTL
jgi:hypothetical protein